MKGLIKAYWLPLQRFYRQSNRICPEAKLKIEKPEKRAVIQSMSML
jgi:hypothetical protein